MSDDKKQEKQDPVFKVKKITKIEDLKLEAEIPESDLTIQSDTHIYQFDHVEEKQKKGKVILKPGTWNLVNTMSGLDFSEVELGSYKLLETIDNTSSIIGEANKFFDKLDVYKKLKREPRRSVLLCSPPGVGKTSAINKVCRKFMKQEGTAVVIWDTSSIRSSSVNSLFQNELKFGEKVKKLIFVMEDIGGGSVEENHGPRGADSSLLNLLDGVGKPFQGIPTFIIATTNNPEQSVSALIDRPGRFDKVIELKTPSESESIELLKFIADRELTEDEIEAAKKAAKNEFSIAHLQEIVVRSMLDDATYMEVVDQLVEHKKRFKNGFQDVRPMGINSGMGIR